MPGEIHQPDHPTAMPDLVFTGGHGDPRIVANRLVGMGQLIENGGLAAIRIAHQSDHDGLVTQCYSSFPASRAISRQRRRPTSSKS